MRRPLLSITGLALLSSLLSWSVAGSYGVALGQASRGGQRGQGGAVSPLPPPTFHHIHLNSVNPDRSIAWYERYWPKGRRTTYGGFPAFQDDFYLLYTKVARQAAGAFDRKAQRSVPQSAFWTFGSVFTGTDTKAFRDRIAALDAKQFELVPLYGGVDGKETATHSGGLPQGNTLLTSSGIRERAEQEKQQPRPAPTGGGGDFAYLVDPDGMLVEVIAGRTESFREHTHFWSERPLCAANWHVEHLGAVFPTTQNNFSRTFTFTGKWDPCDVPVGEVTYPTYMEKGQLRIPAGTAQIANASWIWYPRQCRDGRCGPGNDRPLAKSRGQVVDHVGLTYPDLDAVIAHLKSRNVPILDGPYKLADTRAILIEDLDGLAFELIEAKK